MLADTFPIVWLNPNQPVSIELTGSLTLGLHMTSSTETKERYFEVYRYFSPLEISHCGTQKAKAYEDLTSICAENFGAGNYVVLEIGKNMINRHDHEDDLGLPLSYWFLEVFSVENMRCQRIVRSQKVLDRDRKMLSEIGEIQKLVPMYYEALAASLYVELVSESENLKGGAEQTRIVNRVLELLLSGVGKRQIKQILKNEFAATELRDRPPDKVEKAINNAYDAAKKRIKRKRRKEMPER